MTMPITLTLAKELLQRIALHPDAGPMALTQDPEALTLGTRLLLADRDGSRIELGFEVGAHFIQGAGVVQGGVLASMLEMTLRLTALHALPPGRRASRAALHVDYLRGCDAGAVRAEGRIERAGRSVVFAHARLFNAQGQCLASGSAAMPVQEAA